MEASTAADVAFAGAIGGGYISPEFLPAFDALMSLGKLLELLAPSAVPLSEHVAGIPSSTLVRKTAGCPWSLKGTVMRTVAEELQRSDGHDLSLLDGIKVFYKGGWAQILPDAARRSSTSTPRAATPTRPSRWRRASSRGSARSSPPTLTRRAT